MTMPPHLPPRACSVPAYYVRQSLPWIAVVVILSVLSGIAAALAISAWAIPEGNIASFSDRILLRRTVATEVLDVAVINHVTTRLLDVYDATKETKYHTIPPDAFLGRALVLSSDGWVVLLAGKNVKPTDIIVVDSQGVSYTIEEVVVDAKIGLTYLRVTGGGFRVAAFGTLTNEPLTAWAFTKEKHTASVEVLPPRFTLSEYPVLVLGEPMLLPTVVGEVAPGTVITDERGEVLGVVGEKRTLIPAWMLEHEVRQVIRDRAVVYPNIGIEGMPVALTRAEDGVSRASGIVVTSVTRQARDAGVRVGDRIERVNGAPLSFDTLAEIVLRASEFTLDMVRNGGSVSATISL